MQRYRQNIIIRLAAIAFIITGCAEASESEGNLCPPSGASGIISYIQLGYQQCNNDMPCFDEFRDRSHCPGSAFRCGIDANQQYYCTDGCRPGSVLCHDICIDPLASSEFCGADSTCSNYQRCNSGEICANGKCTLSGQSTCKNGEKRCNINNLETCQTGTWRITEACLGQTPVCDPIAKQCTKTAKQSCVIQDTTLPDSHSICIGNTLFSCQDGSTLKTQCTTNVANADPICDDDISDCSYQCRNGFHDASGKCELNCTASICGNNKIQICGSDGILQSSTACPSVPHAKSYGGCHSTGTKCLVTACDDGFKVSENGEFCVSNSTQGCSADVCSNGSIQLCKLNALQAPISCLAHIADNNATEAKCNDAGTGCLITACRNGFKASDTGESCVSDSPQGCSENVCNNGSIQLCQLNVLQDPVSCLDYIADNNATEAKCNDAGNGCLVTACGTGFKVNGTNNSCVASSTVRHSTGFDFITGSKDSYDDNYNETIDKYPIAVTGRSNLTNSVKDYAISGAGIILSLEKNKDSRIIVSDLDKGIGKIAFDVNGWDDSVIRIVAGDYDSSSSADSDKMNVSKSTGNSGAINNNKKTIEVTINNHATSFTITSTLRTVIDNLSWTDAD